MPDKFFADRDQRGRPAEYLTVQLYRSYGLHADVNPAPEDDYDGRASGDIIVAGHLHEVKTDFLAVRTKRIFVERASLEHTKAYWFDYWILTPYGFDVRVFTHSQLLAFYNAKNHISRGDGSSFEVYVYPHGVAGDQQDNEGVFIPMDVVKAEGMAPWEVMKTIKQQAA